MRHMTAAFAAALAVFLLTACAKKEEAPPAEAPVVEQAAPVDTAPAEPAPVDAAPAEPAPTDDDAEQSGGDKVKP